MRNLLIFATIILAVGCAKKVVSIAPSSTPPIVIVSPVESSSSVAGRAIYDAKCGRCHPVFKTEDFTVKEWQPILMRMAPKARLDSTQKANVLAYVSFHAKAG